MTAHLDRLIEAKARLDEHAVRKADSQEDIGEHLYAPAWTMFSYQA